jgi:hypothetical protein
VLIAPLPKAYTLEHPERRTLTSVLDDIFARVQMILNATAPSSITQPTRRYGRESLPARLYARHALVWQDKQPQGIFRLPPLNRLSLSHTRCARMRRLQLLPP